MENFIKTYKVPEEVCDEIIDFFWTRKYNNWNVLIYLSVVGVNWNMKALLRIFVALRSMHR